MSRSPTVPKAMCYLHSTAAPVLKIPRGKVSAAELQATINDSNTSSHAKAALTFWRELRR
ncbi:hypothetical protein [Prosthecobacter sp.]|uniref:hypothetical protein n=1 Tax=Prosthecobacter sp. TaxID=1965333 RepID=UPI003784BA60